MKKGVIIDIKDQYSYVLCHNAKMKRIPRSYNHEVGKEIKLPFFTLKQTFPIIITFCLVLIVVVLNPLQNQNVQALSYVSLSVNPGLILKVNHGKVIGISYTNKEGLNMTQKIDFVNQSLEDSLSLFIDYCYENGYLMNNQNININVISDDQKQVQSIEKQIQDLIDSYMLKHQLTISINVDQVTSSQHQQAQNLGIPDSKMKLIDLVLTYYPQKTKEELAKEDVDDLIDYLEDQGYDEKVLDKLEDTLEEDDDVDEEDNDEDEEDDD